MSKGWDSTALKKLKSLIGKGLSTSEIGRRLGMSKNAVVGKLNRLGWNAKAGGVAVAEAEVKKTAKKTKADKPVENTKKTVDKKTVDRETEIKKEEKKTSRKSEPKQTPDAKKVQPEAIGKVSEKNLAAHQRIIQHSLEMASLKPNQCRWPIGDPDSEHFHFCGEAVFVGKPYCYEHCKQAYQFAPPKKLTAK